MYLEHLIKSADKKYKKIPISGISFDSRKVEKRNIFFAVEGNKISGSKFVNEAILKGASAIVSNKKIKQKIPCVVVKNVRKSLAEASSRFYKKKPSKIIVVTGTNGKSSVADFFYQILSLNKIPVASIGTLGILSKKYKKKIHLTSPDPVSLHKNLETLARNKINHVILEASSHGLEQKRLDYLNFKIGIFTNFSHDHLDYHKNMNSYFNSKMHLFKNLLNKNSKIITDEENREFQFIKKIADQRKIQKITIGNNSGNIKILYNKYIENKQLIKISIDSKIYTTEIPLIGYFQIKNLLMAALAASKCGLNINTIINQVNKIKPVSGRLECVSNLNNNSNIIVDFAHTPKALEQSLISIKKQFKKEILIVFGCGGERDKKKRLIMGKIAEKYCKKIFVTDDNPRNENPKKIRNEIIKGCKKKVKNIGNRKKAIESAIKELKSNEVLLVAGKGHEKTQDYGKKIINFSDQKIIRQIIQKNKFKFKKYCYQDFLLNKALKRNDIKNVKYNGISINTKTIKKNDLFFCMKGKKKDGHNFAKEALKKGAGRLIVSKKPKGISTKKIIKVKDTFYTLNSLAKVTRDNSSAQIIGITGSVGKTTLKNLVAFILNNYGKVYQSPHSYNNKFGVPFSLSNLKKNIKYGVFEIGMDKKGEIENLAKIVKPEIGVITNISGAHFKNFNTLKDIAKAKAEILDNIMDKGTVILNKDDKFFDFFSNKAKKNKINIISFSSKKKADVFLSNIKKINKYYRITVIVKKKYFYFDVPYSTSNFISNVLACIAVLNVLNLNLIKINKKFKNFNIPSGRGDAKIVKKFKKKFKFIDESYNANPLSMLSAIKNMNNFKIKNKSRKIAFLGDMLELGKKSKKLHKELSGIINKSDIDKVFVYGKYIRETFKNLSKYKKGKIFNNLNEAYYYFSKFINNNDLFMIKGSNATGLNQFSKNIKRI